jgi:hypothetical protein
MRHGLEQPGKSLGDALNSGGELKERTTCRLRQRLEVLFIPAAPLLKNEQFGSPRSQLLGNLNGILEVVSVQPAAIIITA